ncbi:MAG: hypothetical protein EZS28_005767 [Streblomastix strix]|uniref:Uncharacterized protein n=1 Tax=Streblomastix strix TaxID=222440 RepID=A0A5J4WUW0_9EUKA|nr:MAG: hypothetical protein EZS28_005767 [Streblomastix strix]
MSEITVVLQEGRENIIEKGGLVLASLRVAQQLFERFEEVIQIELETGQFIDELFRFYETISSDQIIVEFIDILRNLIKSTTSSQKLKLKQEKYIMPLIHLMENKGENILFRIAQFLSIIIIQMNQTGIIQQEDDLQKVLENNGGLAQIVKIFRNNNIQNRKINKFCALLIGQLCKALKIPDEFRSSVIQCLKEISDDNFQYLIESSSLVLSRLAECKANHTDITTGEFVNLIMKYLQSNNHKIIDHGLLLVLNLLNIGTEETQQVVKEAVPLNLIRQYAQSLNEDIASTSILLIDQLQFIS